MPTDPLLPFVDRSSPPPLQVEAEVDRLGQFLQVTFHLAGDLSQILPQSWNLNPQAQRITGLWETTCFEFFFGVRGQANYWEVNLAATGDWNVFRLDRYRENLQEELRLTELPIELETQSDRLKLSTKLNLDKLGILQTQAIEVSATTVIQAQSGDISYWAVKHAGSEADFHLRESFMIKL